MAVKPKIDLDIPKTLELMEMVVKEFGRDHVYLKPPNTGVSGGATCLYAHGSKPGCIVAQVLFRAGVTVAALKRFDGIGSIGHVASADQGIILDHNVIDVLAVAQTKQDNLQTWGTALDAAKRRASELLDRVEQSR